MFGLEDDDASGREKCYTTVAQLPQFIDPKQPPTKKSPFSTILSHPLVHTVEVTLPKKAYSSIESSLNSKLQKLRYARISMNLSSLIDEGFFNTYIKKGNVLMLSEGRSGLDNVFTLVDGVLKLELSKEIYEGTGLTGNPIRYGGKKHGKERFLVELNLRLPSMLHGTESLGVAKDDTTLKGNNPEIIPCEPVYTTKENITTPSFSDIQFTNETPESELKDLCVEVSEWLGMVSLQSRRVSADDDIDPYLCRYDTPDIGDASASDLITLKWHGFIPPKWIIHLFTTLFRETGPRVCKTPAWFSLSAGALGRGAVEGRDGYTIMVLPAAAPEDKDAKAQDARHFICWEYVGASII